MPEALSPEQTAQLAKLWKRGYGVGAAAVDTGLSTSTVSKYFAIWDIAKPGSRINRRRPAPSTKEPTPADAIR